MKCWDRVDDVRALTAQVSALVVLTNHLLGPDDATVGAELTTPRGHFSRRAPSQPLSRTQTQRFEEVRSHPASVARSDGRP